MLCFALNVQADPGWAGETKRLGHRLQAHRWHDIIELSADDFGSPMHDATQLPYMSAVPKQAGSGGHGIAR